MEIKDENKVWYNVYASDLTAKDQSKVKLAYVWKLEDQPKTLDAFYGGKAFNFGGHQLHVGTLPWSHHVQADPLPDQQRQPNKRFKNYFGYEIFLLDAAARALNFKYKISNHPSDNWGNLAQGGWSGLTSDAADGVVDIVISDIFLTHGRSQVFEGSFCAFSIESLKL